MFSRQLRYAPIFSPFRWMLPAIYVKRRYFLPMMRPRDMSHCFDYFINPSSRHIDDRRRSRLNSEHDQTIIYAIWENISWCTTVLNNTVIQANSWYLGKIMPSILASTYILLRGLVGPILYFIVPKGCKYIQAFKCTPVFYLVYP